MTGGFELDLIAYFKLMQEDATNIIDENNEKSLDDIINEIERMFV